MRIALGAADNAPIAALVTAAAAQYGVDPSLALAVAQQESGLNPNLVNSRTGAGGVMQLMPATAASLGVTSIMDPTQNVYGGVRYLAMLLVQFGGNVAEAVAAYDWGPGNVSAAIAANPATWLLTAPTETQNYVASVAGVTGEEIAAAASAPVPVTIDASTGEVIDTGTVPTYSTPSPLATLPSWALPAAIAAAAYFLLRDLL